MFRPPLFSPRDPRPLKVFSAFHRRGSPSENLCFLESWIFDHVTPVYIYNTFKLSSKFFRNWSFFQQKQQFLESLIPFDGIIRNCLRTRQGPVCEDMYFFLHLSGFRASILLKFPTVQIFFQVSGFCMLFKIVPPPSCFVFNNWVKSHRVGVRLRVE